MCTVPSFNAPLLVLPQYMAPPFLRMCRNASEHAQHIIFVKVRTPAHCL